MGAATKGHESAAPPGEFQHRGRWPRSLTRADKVRALTSINPHPTDPPRAALTFPWVSTVRSLSGLLPQQAPGPGSVMPHPHTNPPMGGGDNDPETWGRVLA